jgi:outer membrane protein assembly factor BamE
MAAPTRLLPLVCLLIGLTGLAGCSTNLHFPYRMEVVQGNVVTREMVAQLRPGLTRDQVRTLLGSPLLTDVFHANRWDYVFTIRRQGAEPQQRVVTVLFDGDRVSRVEAGDAPSEREFIASIDTTKPASRRTPLELDEAQLRAIPIPAPSRVARAPGTAASGPARSYPPLESTSPSAR